jgi:hypothetical protein
MATKKSGPDDLSPENGDQTTEDQTTVVETKETISCGEFLAGFKNQTELAEAFRKTTQNETHDLTTWVDLWQKFKNKPTDTPWSEWSKGGTR